MPRVDVTVPGIGMHGLRRTTGVARAQAGSGQALQGQRHQHEPGKDDADEAAGHPVILDTPPRRTAVTGRKGPDTGDLSQDRPI